jgi:hypothetical protein
MGYTVREVQRMTYGKWYRLFKYFQNYHDIKVSKITYRQLRAEQHKRDEWL